jgi:large subunit ribosomal protein L15
MQLNDVRRIRVPRKNRNRIGRGPGSGWGVTAGRGYKGQGKRTGTRRRLRFEGGQMALYRRLPKKGFRNHAFRVRYHVVNVGQIDAAFAAGETVDLATIQAKGLAPKKAKYLKILGFGRLGKAVTVRCHGVSGGAKEKVEGAKGTLEVLTIAVEHREKGQARGAEKPAAKPAKGGGTKGPRGGAAK